MQRWDQVKRTDQPTGQYKINLNPNPNTKYVLIYYAINAGPFFSLDPSAARAWSKIDALLPCPNMLAALNWGDVLYHGSGKGLPLQPHLTATVVICLSPFLFLLLKADIGWQIIVNTSPINPKIVA